MQEATEAGYLFEAHSGTNALCSGLNFTDPLVQTELAAFLMFAQEHTYYACGKWIGAAPEWHPSFDYKVGSPLSNATTDEEAQTYTRKFDSGLSITFNYTSQKGTASYDNNIIY